MWSTLVGGVGVGSGLAGLVLRLGRLGLVARVGSAVVVELRR